MEWFKTNLGLDVKWFKATLKFPITLLTWVLGLIYVTVTTIEGFALALGLVLLCLALPDLIVLGSGALLYASLRSFNDTGIPQAITFLAKVIRDNASTLGGSRGT